MASLLFYESIVVLSREQHGDLRIQTGSRDCSFAAHTSYVPLVASEFYQTAADYPIVFAGSGNEAFPVALLSLQEGRNPYVASNGEWRLGTYLPAFVRRYPFLLARAGEGESAELTVCIDETYSGFSREEGQRLFNERGTQTEYMANTVQFLQQYQAETERTREFVQRLNELNLLERRDLRLRDIDGTEYVLEDFQLVNGQRLDELDEATVFELHRNGFLGWIHAHLVSVTGLERFPVRLQRIG